MNKLLILAFLFSIGSVLGWCLELVYRRFFSHNNPDHKWMNPGFCMGPYVPLYGTGLSILYILASLGTYLHFTDSGIGRVIMFLLMAIMMTVTEYLAGLLLLHGFHLRLWDYSHEWGNIKGLICPKFSLYWSLIGAFYYFLIHSNVLNALDWLSRNLQFSFFIGMFFGMFFIDVAYSGNLVMKIKTYAAENELIVHLEDVKLHLEKLRRERQVKARFFLFLRTEMNSLREYLDDARDEFTEKMEERLRLRQMRKRK